MRKELPKCNYGELHNGFTSDGLQAVWVLMQGMHNERMHADELGLGARIKGRTLSAS